MRIRAFTVSIAGLLLAACGSDSPPPPPPPPTPTAAQGTILDDQLRAIERAKSVEATIQKSKDDTDAALEAAEGG